VTETQTAPADLNAAFAAERAQQVQQILNWNAGIPARREAAEQAAADMRARNQERIDNGELVPIPGRQDAYRVTTGWDAGETWIMRQPRGFEQEQPMLLPESNLDDSTGAVALYTREPAWHGLGTVIPAGISDLNEVLRIAGIDYEVLKRPVRMALDDEETVAELIAKGLRPQTVEVPGKFVTCRADTMAPLGVVGAVYNPFQSWVAGAFLQQLVDDHSIVFESAGATYGGAHQFIGMQLPDDLRLDLGDGVTDVVKQYLYWLNTHDGSGSARVTVSPWRVECGNTERFNLRDAKASWSTRHTTNALDEERMKEARRTLGLTVKFFDSFKVEEEALARTDLAVSEFEKVIADLWPLGSEPTDRQKRFADERAGELTGMYRWESEKLGRTAYAAERAVTDWLDHVAPKKTTGDKMAAARATALIEGDADKAKTQLHQRLMLTVK
jgi:phage/plasmid-like protein (TIGR03299 family)